MAEGWWPRGDAANTAAPTEGRRLLIDDPHQFDGVKIVGVDEHVWRYTRRGDKCVTVIIDSPANNGTLQARLLDMVAGRSAAYRPGGCRQLPRRSGGVRLRR